MENYQKTKQSYEKNSKGFVNQWKDTNAIDNTKIEKFIALLPQKTEEIKILDIGAGFGKDVHYLCNKGFDCVGIDFCDEFIAQSKTLYTNVNILKMSFLEIDFSENSFDALWSRGALFHISKDDFGKVLKILQKILKPGGVFYLQLIEGEHDGLLGSIGKTEGAAHYSYYTAAELSALMATRGFSMIATHPESGWLNHYYRLSK